MSPPFYDHRFLVAPSLHLPIFTPIFETDPPVLQHKRGEVGHSVSHTPGQAGDFISDEAAQGVWRCLHVETH